MEAKQVWELIINTGGDPLKSMLMLNGELIIAAEASVVISADNSTFLNIKVPITNGNLEIKTDATKPIYRQVITATSKE